jgi:hypothetical protein
MSHDNGARVDTIVRQKIRCIIVSLKFMRFTWLGFEVYDVCLKYDIQDSITTFIRILVLSVMGMERKKIGTKPSGRLPLS